MTRLLLAIAFSLVAGRAGALDVWVASDPHVCNANIPAASRPWCDRYKGIRSLRRGIEQSRQIADWQIGLVLGDFGMTNTADEGIEVAAQFNTALGADRETVYTLAGNHDATCSDGMLWFRKYVDPFGEFTATSGVAMSDYPYPPVTTGGATWANYYFDVGNVRFVMLSDRNWSSVPVGRCPGSQGYPSGAVAENVFDWLSAIIAANEAAPEPKIIIIAHHHMLRDTTAGSCMWCGRSEFHAGLPNWQDEARDDFAFHGANGQTDVAGEIYEAESTRGAGYLYWIGDTPVTDEFADLLSACSTCALWLGGHTHLTRPDAELLGMGACADRYGMTHCNVSALTSYWSGFQPMSRILTLTPDSDTAELRYILHHATGAAVHEAVETIDLKRPFTP